MRYQELGTYVFPSIPYLRMRVRLRAQTDAVLPRFKGSLLRGALGHGMRRAVCAMGPACACERCTLRFACVHARLFESFFDGGPRPFVEGLPASPHPYVLEPGATTREYQAGDFLTFDLLLLGQAVELQGFAVMAIDGMAANGLGVRRHPFRLEEIRWQDAQGYWRSGTTRSGRRWCWPGRVEAVLPPSNGFTANRLTLRFLSPTRIKVRNRLIQDFRFETLALKMLRRALEIAHFHVPGQAVDWQYRPLLERARQIRVVESRLLWYDWQRYSNRQRRKMMLGGFVGDVVVEGDLEPFAPLLRTAEVIHVGKGTTFGLGRMEIQPH